MQLRKERTMASSKCNMCIKQDVCRYKDSYQSFRDSIEEYSRKNIPLDNDVFIIETKCKSYRENSYSFISNSPITTNEIIYK